MKYYNIDDFGYLISVTETNDPNYSKPEKATLIGPPEVETNQRCKFDGNHWVVENIEAEDQIKIPTLDERMSAVENALLRIL